MIKCVIIEICYNNGKSRKYGILNKCTGINGGRKNDVLNSMYMCDDNVNTLFFFATSKTFYQDTTLKKHFYVIMLW